MLYDFILSGYYGKENKTFRLTETAANEEDAKRELIKTLVGALGISEKSIMIKRVETKCIL